MRTRLVSTIAVIVAAAGITTGAAGIALAAAGDTGSATTTTSVQAGRAMLVAPSPGKVTTFGRAM